MAYGNSITPPGGTFNTTEWPASPPSYEDAIKGTRFCGREVKPCQPDKTTPFSGHSDRVREKPLDPPLQRKLKVYDSGPIKKLAKEITTKSLGVTSAVLRAAQAHHQSSKWLFSSNRTRDAFIITLRDESDAQVAKAKRALGAKSVDEMLLISKQEQEFHCNELEQAVYRYHILAKAGADVLDDSPISEARVMLSKLIYARNNLDSLRGCNMDLVTEATRYMTNLNYGKLSESDLCFLAEAFKDRVQIILQAAKLQRRDHIGLPMSTTYRQQRIIPAQGRHSYLAALETAANDLKALDQLSETYNITVCNTSIHWSELASCGWEQ